ncbi:MAG: hypothetical protein AAFR22_10855, partial [Chloroflexota bacterium]
VATGFAVYVAFFLYVLIVVTQPGGFFESLDAVEVEITRANFHRLDGLYIPQYSAYFRGTEYRLWQSIETCLRIDVDPSTVDGLLDDWEMPDLTPDYMPQHPIQSCTFPVVPDWWQLDSMTEFSGLSYGYDGIHGPVVYQIVVDQSDSEIHRIYLMILDG